MQLPLFASRPHRGAAASGSSVSGSKRADGWHSAPHRPSVPPRSLAAASDKRAHLAAALLVFLLLSVVALPLKLRGRLRSRPRRILISGPDGAISSVITPTHNSLPA